MDEVAGGLWSALTGAPLPAGVLRITGPAAVLPGPFRAGAAAAGAVGVTTLAAADLLRARGVEPGTAAVHTRAAAAAFRSERHVQVAGAPVGKLWSALSGDYRAADGWVKLHCNYAHHADAACRALGVPAERDRLAAAVAGRAAWDVQEAVVAGGGAAAAMRTAAQWRAHPQGRAVADLPLVDLVRFGEADPVPLPHGDRPLSGIRLLELTHVIAGPVCGRVLAAHGADVLHIGAPHLPTVAPLVVDTGFGKRSAHLDLRSAYGLERLRALIAEEGARYAGVEHPVPLPAQALDHATGWLAAGAVMAALRRRSVEGGSWRVRLALARTAGWLDSLGRTSDAVDLGDVTDLLEVSASQFGPVTHVPMPGVLDAYRPGWSDGPHLPGSDTAAWC